MKKLMFVLAALVVAPAMAAVDFEGSYASGVITISYTTTDGDLPRGLALNLASDDGVTIESLVADSYDCFNVYLDYAFDNSEGYTVGAGDPIADPAGPGVGTLPATEIAVCMGYLDEDGDETLGEPGPDACTSVVQLNVSGSGTVVVSADTLRGPDSGVVGSELASDLPITIIVDDDGCNLVVGGYVGAGDVLVTQTMVDAWVAAGSPDLWCKNCFPRGDANSDCALTFTDVSAVIAAWPPNPYAYNADFNMDGAITFTDVSAIIAHWPPNPGCDVSCVAGE